ncbi:hypothetical protein CANARDRAFT_27214 [[Candida] arabinofermentans NRRL YB-2248]|uniref:JmjC domain-containing protein n=1 Tax=[Candida] arabinofermentans NRRL YB-2248 TaxID=983967 RepID=A0A1E4T502_9ASCO|nr:hypothetical protein CANARDRAFT_27214 [[Candida] arabinofermentans NRRL YB-2248]
MQSTEEAPTLYPTKEEFTNPISYLNSKEIIKLGEQYGILKVKPPKHWQPPFSINKSTFKFHTRLQNLNELNLTNRSRQFWLSGFNNYLRMKGKRQVENGYIELNNMKTIHLYDIYVEKDFHNYVHSVKNHELFRDFLNYCSYLKNHLEEKANPDVVITEKFNFEKFQSDTTAINQNSGSACEICSLKDDPSHILICDDCEKNYHMRCLSPPLTKIPKNDWFCDDCLKGSNGDYGFEEDFDSIFKIDEFQEACFKFSVDYCNEHLGGNMKPSVNTLEKEFWRLVDSEEGDLEVRYGADIHNESLDEISGFPTANNPSIDQKANKEYSEHPFNLTNLPFSEGSLLNYIKDENREQISGMTVPWIYIGSMFSTFCWHKEDHYTLSANYCHLGETKKWYGIPANQCELFESVCHDISPDYFSKQPDLLHQLVSLVSPDKISNLVREKLGTKIKIYYVNQNPNEFVITFPKVYHAGFNCGFNVNEAVNFTMPYWLNYGRDSIDEYKLVKKENVFNHYKLLRNILDDLLVKSNEPSIFSNEIVHNMIKSSFTEYCKEIRRFKRSLMDKRLIEFVSRLTTKSFSDHMKKLQELKSEEKRTVRNSTRMISMRQHRHSMSHNGPEIDELLCSDCKSSVNFKWIEIDTLKETATNSDYLTPKMESSSRFSSQDDEYDADSKHHIDYSSNTHSQLPTPNQSPKQCADVESEFLKIISEASQTHATKKRRRRDVDQKSREVIVIEDDDPEPKIRKSKRLSKKPSPTIVSINVEDDSQDVETYRKQQRMKQLSKMHNKRNKNPQFGKAILCLHCFSQLLKSVVKGSKDEELLIAASTVYDEFDSGDELEKYVYFDIQPKVLRLL